MRANIFPVFNRGLTLYKNPFEFTNGADFVKLNAISSNKEDSNNYKLPEILFITSYPPRECGIATYSQDLRNSILEKFGDNFALNVCALESEDIDYDYPEEVKYRIQTQHENQFLDLAKKINADKKCEMIFLQHEFGLFGGNYGHYILFFLMKLKKPIAITFHTVLPNPNEELKKIVQKIVYYATEIIVMTNNSASILINHYAVDQNKISIIAHGTHLVSSISDLNKKQKTHFSDRIVLSTFGLLNEGKNIETALDALPKIVAKFPNILYLIIGKTHPEVVKKEGEKYRDSLYTKVHELHLENNVKFINKYVTLSQLIKYLQRTEIYLFTAKDPNQAVSGTLAYAMACGCPVISTPIPHSKELLDGAGVNFDFQDANQLADATIKLLYNPKLLKEMHLNALHKIAPTSWQNVAIAHADLTQKYLNKNNQILKFNLPPVILDHIKRLTTKDGMIQFSTIAIPDLESGYTLDDNARALIAVVKHYEITGDRSNLDLIKSYLTFIIFCQQQDGKFLNYVDKHGNFFEKNNNENLEDSNGRAIWALGEFASYKNLFSQELIDKATAAIEKSLIKIHLFQSPRAISFAIKGLYFYNLDKKNESIIETITLLADNLVSKFRGVSQENWHWYEEYLTYANSLIPEAMLYASISTGSKLYRDIAKETFDFLLSIIFKEDQIKVISNQGWYQKGEKSNTYGEQPIDVAYTVLALNTFYNEFHNQEYLDKMEVAFNWFLGKNHLHQIVYNPVTGGCHDGLEEDHVNLNQGAESTVSYLIARMVFEKSLEFKVTVHHYEDKLLNV